MVCDPARERFVDTVCEHAKDAERYVDLKEAHFRAKIYGFSLQLRQMEDNLKGMARQFNDMEKQIRYIEDLKEMLKGDEKYALDAIDLQGIREMQRARKQTIEGLLDIDLPSIKGNAFLKVDGVPEEVLEQIKVEAFKKKG